MTLGTERPARSGAPSPPGLSEQLTLDESILTGESEAVGRHSGREVRSGSFAVEGAGAYEVTAVGAESYAVRIAGEARTFRHNRRRPGRLSSYWFALYVLDLPVLEAWTVATTAVIATGLTSSSSSKPPAGSVAQPPRPSCSASSPLPPRRRRWWRPRRAGRSSCWAALWLTDPRFAPGGAHTAGA